jgi:hypothetical protein
VSFDSGVYPNLPLTDPVYYCLNDPPRCARCHSGFRRHAQLVLDRRQALAAAPIPETDTAGIFYWLVAQKMKVCNSLTDTALAYVTKRPVADFIMPPSICVDDTATVMFSGSIGVGPILEYNWNWGEAQVRKRSGRRPLAGLLAYVRHKDHQARRCRKQMQLDGNGTHADRSP